MMRLGGGGDDAARRAIRSRWKLGAAKAELGLEQGMGDGLGVGAQPVDADEAAAFADDGRRAEAVVVRSGSSELDAATMNAARRLAARTGAPTQQATGRTWV